MVKDARAAERTVNSVVFAVRRGVRLTRKLVTGMAAVPNAMANVYLER
jgi:hypothetical protein